MQILSQQSQFTAFFAVRTYFQAACGAKCGNFFKFGNVCVDNGSGAVFGIVFKQFHFGLKIVFHGFVKVKMILCQVGKTDGFEFESGQPMQSQAMARGLYRNMRNVIVSRFAELFKHSYVVGSCPAGIFGFVFGANAQRAEAGSLKTCKIPYLSQKRNG